jgi:hypothetical protein
VVGVTSNRIQQRKLKKEIYSNEVYGLATKKKLHWVERLEQRSKENIIPELFLEKVEEELRFHKLKPAKGESRYKLELTEYDLVCIVKQIHWKPVNVFVIVTVLKR